VLYSLRGEQLQEARRRSGRLGGRPRRPSVAEARVKALDELVPRALQVLKVHLGTGDEINANAWPAALRVFEYAFGREVPDGIESVVLPDSADGISALSWIEMRALAVRLLAEPQATDAENAITNVVPPTEHGP
jgi:O-acetyl-ADP-ribose deacetylase (regulator of RNase III)